jgi:ubiquinone/menaquinone biosynthesis C-methylase UbiE
MENYNNRRVRYYDQAAPEFDYAFQGIGSFADRKRPAGFKREFRALEHRISALPPCQILDVACGTGFLTRRLRGEVIGLDLSERMLAIARARVPEATFVRGDAFSLPFANSSFDKVFTSNFYGLLLPSERTRFLREARRVATELVVVDLRASLDGTEPGGWQERTLSDGSHHRIYRKYFMAQDLAEELGAGRILFEGRWFVMVAG